MGLDGQPIQSRLQLADGGLKTSQTFESTCVIQDIDGNHSFQLESVRVVDRLPDLSGSIPSTSDALQHEHLSGIELPVIEGNRVELLIGTGAPELHVFSEVRQGGDHGLWAGKTPLGWVLFGRDPIDHTNAVISRHDKTSQVHLVTTHALEPISEAVCPCQLEFIDLTQDCDGCLPSLDDEKALDQMETSCRWEDGHFTIRLPWRDGCPNLPNNYPVALSRLKSLGRRLLREPEIQTKYQNKVNEMIQLGHAYEVDDKMSDPERGRLWYIPHHCTGGKFRVVFDCAASYEGTSLNKQLLQGPDNTNTLLGVLFRFRPHAVALVGDIRSMFHQINVDPIDQTTLRFLWWEDGDPTRAVKVYQLTVHTFGLTSSPSVAGYALRRTATENRTNASERTRTSIQRNLYVDDLLISVPSSEEAVRLHTELNDLLASGGFQLAKYSSNRREVLEAIRFACPPVA